MCSRCLKNEWQFIRKKILENCFIYYLSREHGQRHTENRRWGGRDFFKEFSSESRAIQDTINFARDRHIKLHYSKTFQQSSWFYVKRYFFTTILHFFSWHHCALKYIHIERLWKAQLEDTVLEVLIQKVSNMAIAKILKLFIILRLHNVFLYFYVKLLCINVFTYDIG